MLERLLESASELCQGGRSPGSFTGAEQRVLGPLRLRLSNKELASSLQISERSVKLHLGNIFNKVGVHGRHALMDMLKSGNLSGSGDAWGPAKGSEG
jgi:DNA-binding CsgD family transcriptional regulator